MKKTIIVAALALLSSVAVSAQERMSAEQREKAIAERIGSAADRMAKDFDLKDDAKKSFVETYTAYQKEMFATNQFQGQRLEQNGRDGEKKELTKEEITFFAKAAAEKTAPDYQLSALLMAIRLNGMTDRDPV